MEATLSFFPIDPACLILAILGVSLVEYLFSHWTEQPARIHCQSIDLPAPIAMHQLRSEDETPLATHCGLKHLRLRNIEQHFSGVKRRLDEHF
ncbi:hypothetical protein KR018_003206 [Drosophila ironensis]|nr:hypothetical protein KR018_003206 [Drosophila ironensis]